MDKERGEKQVKQTSEKKYSTDVDGNKNPDTNIEPIPENEAGIPESASDSFSCRKTENSLKRATVLPQIPNESEQYSADEDGQEADPDQKTKENERTQTSPEQAGWTSAEQTVPGSKKTDSNGNADVKKTGKNDQTSSSTDRKTCQIVSDLLPLYIEGLTRPMTETFIENHLQECESCSDRLKAMKEPEPAVTSEKNNDERIRNSLKKTKTLLHRKGVMAAVLLVFCLILAFGTGALVIQNAKLDADDLQILQHSTQAGDVEVFEFASLDPGIGFLSSSLSTNEQGEAEVTIYGGGGLFNQSSTEKVVIPRPVSEIRINGKLVYQDGEIITSQCRQYARYLNGYAGDTGQMQLSRPSFTSQTGPVNLYMDATSAPDSSIWTWVIPDNELSEFSVQEYNAFREQALIVLALTPNLQEIQLQDKDGLIEETFYPVATRLELKSMLMEAGEDPDVTTPADLQRVFNLLSPLPKTQTGTLIEKETEEESAETKTQSDDESDSAKNEDGSEDKPDKERTSDSESSQDAAEKPETESGK